MLKPIETLYKGYRFRSRLESRWAVFFDSLGIRYEYEKEGYELPSGRYLPDFWLPAQQYWIEIKGQPASYEEITKARELCEASGYNVYIFDDSEIQICDGTFDANSAKAFFKSKDGYVVEDDNYQWVQCLFCGIFEIHYSGWANRLSCACKNTKQGRYDLLELAYINARKARFEYEDAEFIHVDTDLEIIAESKEVG